MIDDAIKLIDSVAWPGIAIAVIILFRPAVAGIIESAKSRGFTLKVGGQELTMGEVNEQQRNLIADLQAQFVDLRKLVEGSAGKLAAQPVVASFATPTSSAVLWIDDHPKNNSYFVEQLTASGIKVDLAVTTSEGLARFSSGKYQVIVSDMGRREDGQEVPDAGVALVKAIRTRDAQVPIIVYCSINAARQFGDKAKQLGATAVTSSPTELAGLLNFDALKPSS
jgi:CheY-like chemotaxis protein